MTDATWEQRVEQASCDEIVIKRILREEAKGRSLNEAIAQVLPANRRSWALRRISSYREQGFEALEALIDARTPREAAVSIACRQSVQAAREANPRLTVNEALEILRKQRITPQPSESTIKREFARVKERRKYARRKAAARGSFGLCQWLKSIMFSATVGASLANFRLKPPPEIEKVEISSTRCCTRVRASRAYSFS